MTDAKLSRGALVLLASLLYAPGTLLFFARREPGQRVFDKGEVLLFTVFCIAALAALAALWTGALTL